MSILKDFPPCDAFVADLDWHCGPCGVTRDSGPLEESNFDAACLLLDEVDPGMHDHEVLTWRHWACGWVSEIFTRPGSTASDKAQELRCQLDTYPALDEHLFSEYEATQKAAEAMTCGE